MTDQTMSLPQVGSPDRDRKPSLKQVGRLPGSKFKMNYPYYNSTTNRDRYQKDVQAMRIRMENQSPDKIELVSN